MSTPSSRKAPTVTQIGSNGSAAQTSVSNGDKIQWQAPQQSTAWVNPPNIFVGGCATGNVIKLKPGEIGPNPACVVSHKPGSFQYGCGIGDPPVPPAFRDGGEIIIVDGKGHKDKKHY